MIPFRPDMQEAIRAGRKTATSRTHSYGLGVHTAGTGGPQIRVTMIRRIPLREVAEQHHAAEGFDSPEAFQAVWVALHRRAGWRPDQVVYFHEFVLTEFTA